MFVTVVLIIVYEQYGVKNSVESVVTHLFIRRPMCRVCLFMFYCV